MKKLRTIIIIILSMLLAFSTVPLVCDAHPTAREHDKDLEKVLFGSGFSKYKSSQIEDYVNALEYASYLTIDQFGGNGEQKYIDLKALGMGGLPLFFSSIDYSYDLAGSGKQINANTHRLYTHQGWERDYSSKSQKIELFWKLRRRVLLGTVNSIFNFSTITIFGYDDKCESMAGIIYYVHILGDYMEADNYKKIALLPDLAGRVNANDTDKDYDIITCLKKYSELLFADQEGSIYYNNLMNGYDDISEKAGKLVRSTGGVNSDEEFEEYHQYAEDLFELLVDNMPKLLKKEEFFSDAFQL